MWARKEELKRFGYIAKAKAKILKGRSFGLS
jgi:hypothetical protein